MPGPFVMTKLAAVLLIVVVPLVLSLAWFAFWVVRLLKASRQAREKAGAPPSAPNP